MHKIHEISEITGKTVINVSKCFKLKNSFIFLSNVAGTIFNNYKNIQNIIFKTHFKLAELRSYRSIIDRIFVV